MSACIIYGIWATVIIIITIIIIIIINIMNVLELHLLVYNCCS